MIEIIIMSFVEPTSLTGMLLLNIQASPPIGLPEAASIAFSEKIAPMPIDLYDSST